MTYLNQLISICQPCISNKLYIMSKLKTVPENNVVEEE